MSAPHQRLRAGVAGLLTLLVPACGEPPTTAPSAPQVTQFIAMRDGVRLATDVYLPPGPGPFATVIVRTPYGKSDELYLKQRFNSQGVAVVLQDMRGRFDSEGQDQVFLTDGDDGYDTCAWIVEQPWSNKTIVAIGESARGIAQYLLAATSPPGLVAISPQVSTPNLFTDGLFQGGVYRQALVHNWLKGQDSLHFEDTIASHPLQDAFWAPVETLDRPQLVNVAALHTVGWYDIFQRGGIDAFVAYQNHGGDGARQKQKLIVGPWAHGEGSELAYPSNAEEPPIDEAAFLESYLNPDADQSVEDAPAVHYYVMGDVDDPAAPGNTWRQAQDWPPEAANIRMHLVADGALEPGCPTTSNAATRYTFDPNDPSPTICGANLELDAGPCDQREVEQRADVLVFETPVLTAPMEITGRVRAHLFVDIDQTDADLMVRLTDVYPDGRSMLITDGALRLAHRNTQTELELLEPGEVAEAVVDLWSTSIILNTGHRLRVSITSSNYPRFAVNRNNGLPFPQSVTGPARVVHVNVHHSPGLASYVELPDPTQGSSEVTECE